MAENRWPVVAAGERVGAQVEERFQLRPFHAQERGGLVGGQAAGFFLEECLVGGGQAGRDGLERGLARAGFEEVGTATGDERAAAFGPLDGEFEGVVGVEGGAQRRAQRGGVDPESAGTAERDARVVGEASRSARKAARSTKDMPPGTAFVAAATRSTTRRSSGRSVRGVPGALNIARLPPVESSRPTRSWPFAQAAARSGARTTCRRAAALGSDWNGSATGMRVSRVRRAWRARRQAARAGSSRPGSPDPTATECAQIVPYSRDGRQVQRFSMFVAVLILRPALYSRSPSLTMPCNSGGEYVAPLTRPASRKPPGVADDLPAAGGDEEFLGQRDGRGGRERVAGRLHGGRNKKKRVCAGVRGQTLLYVYGPGNANPCT